MKKFFSSQRYRLCAYSLLSILVWSGKTFHPCAVANGESLVVGVESDAMHEEKRHLILPLSPGKEYSPKALRDLALKSGFEKYYFVPDDYIRTFGRSETDEFFEIEEQPELHDYVYLTSDLAELKGNKYSKKRNLIKQFRREYADRVQIEKITRSAVPECLDFLEKWCEERDCEADPDADLACEKLAATNALENLEILEGRGLLLRIDGVVSAFGIGSRVTEDMGAFHFEKAFSRIKGCYQFFDNLCAKQLFKGYTYINKESNMGVPGIAQAKQSYHPVEIIKSYKLSVKA
ncbi:phosphatidylglycerol lysyltransferase domain-containing protein [Desulfococcaceae bacterium HSG8]|nr:phosphatidylglycerol lysyltransferase domain-containing protein [Desulfococcaceae bacterium HSG8]